MKKLILSVMVVAFAVAVQAGGEGCSAQAAKGTCAVSAKARPSRRSWEERAGEDRTTLVAVAKTQRSWTTPWPKPAKSSLKTTQRLNR